jgi:hypothetical protein
MYLVRKRSGRVEQEVQLQSAQSGGVAVALDGSKQVEEINASPAKGPEGTVDEDGPLGTEELTAIKVPITTSVSLLCLRWLVP